MPNLRCPIGESMRIHRLDLVAELAGHRRLQPGLVPCPIVFRAGGRAAGRFRLRRLFGHLGGQPRFCRRRQPGRIAVLKFRLPRDAQVAAAEAKFNPAGNRQPRVHKIIVAGTEPATQQLAQSHPPQQRFLLRVAQRQRSGPKDFGVRGQHSSSAWRRPPRSFRVPPGRRKRPRRSIPVLPGVRQSAAPRATTAQRSHPEGA